MNVAKETKLSKFKERFASLRGDMTQAEFAEFLGISRPTVGFYENGERIPDALVLKRIAERCGVTTDYLVGLKEEPSTDPNIQMISDYTGLSELAILNLRSILERRFGSNYKKIFSDFIASEFFTGAILSIAEFFAVTEFCDTAVAEYIDFLRYLMENHNDIDFFDAKNSRKWAENSYTANHLSEHQKSRSVAYFQAGEYIRRFIDSKTTDQIKDERSKIQEASLLWNNYIGSISTEDFVINPIVDPYIDLDDFAQIERAIHAATFIFEEDIYADDPETE